MSYTFTPAEQVQIQAAIDACTGLSIDNYGRYSALDSGDVIPFYKTLSDMINSKLGWPSDLDAATRQYLINAKDWLDVAIGANSHVGMQSTFIRTYTNRQGELRLGKTFTEPQMQMASNAVGANFATTLFTGDAAHGLLPWTIPTIDQIANVDAKVIGEVIFKGLLPPDDTAITKNAAWSGTFGFSLLGGADPYQTGRLISTGDTKTADTLDDFKNLLFAVDSYNHALMAAYQTGASDIANLFSSSVAKPLRTQFHIGMNSGNWLGFINDVAARTPAIAPIVKLITDVGINNFFDMLKGASLGQPMLGTTTDANFASNAFGLFSTITPAELQQTSAALMPTDAAAISSLAQSDVNARAALVALSSVSVQVSDNVARSISVYDPSAGHVNSKYFEDRAAMLAALIQEKMANNKTLDVWGSHNYQYKDLADSYKVSVAGVTSYMYGQVPILSTDPAQEIIFGADGKTLQGGTQDDHLFAGTGTETLKGGGGKDAYYILANQTGVKDTITDVGGKGSIWVGNTQLKEELTRVSGKDNTWTDASQTQYTFDPVTNQLTITGGQLVGNGEKIIINDFNLNQAQTNADGYLGLHIKEVVKLKKGTEHLTNAQVFNQAGGPVDPPPGVYAYTAYVSAISDKPQTVTLGLSGADPAGFAVDTGNGIVQFVNGQITLTIPAGRDSVTFGLINTTDVPTPETIQLTETLNGNTAVTDTLAVTYTASPAANTTQANYTIAGGYAPREFKTEIPAGTTTIDPTWLNPTYATGSTHTDPDTGLVTVLSYIVSYNLKDAAGNLIPDMGKPTPNKNADLLGSSGNDEISTIANATYLDARQGGNDTISGDQNNDYILAGDGNNIITGQGGKDILTAGNGNNQIYANDKVDIVTALAQRQNAQPTNTQGDYIAVGNGNNTIVGGSGNDAILMGNGDNTVYCGPGSVTLMGGVSAEPPAAFYSKGRFKREAANDAEGRLAA